MADPGYRAGRGSSNADRPRLGAARTPRPPRASYWTRHSLAVPAAGDLVTLNPFALETSVDTTTLHRWARRGLLTGVVADRTGKRCLPRRVADQFLADYPSLRADQAAQWLHPSVVKERLGVTWRDLDRLIRTGQLVAVRGPAGHHRIPADSLPGMPAPAVDDPAAAAGDATA